MGLGAQRLKVSDEYPQQLHSINKALYEKKNIYNNSFAHNKMQESAVLVMLGVLRAFCSLRSQLGSRICANGARRWLFMTAGLGRSVCFPSPVAAHSLSSALGMLADGVRGERAGLKDS